MICNKIFSIIRIELKNTLYYRADAFMNFFSSLLYLFVSVMIWRSLYSENILMQKTMITYLILVSVASIFVNDNLQSVFAYKIRSGSISADFLLPISFKKYMLCVSIGKGGGHFFLSTIPTVIVALLLWGIVKPIDLQGGCLYIIAQIFGFCLALEMNFLLAQVMLYTKNRDVTAFAFWTLTAIFGGRYMPYWLYPRVLLVITKCLPFHLFYSVPISIYLGKLNPMETYLHIMYQIFWFILLIWFNKLIYIKTSLTVTIQGG